MGTIPVSYTHLDVYKRQELKNLYDFYPDLKIVATGSSAIAINEGKADLSRRASIYHLHTLSLREYINLFHNNDIEPLSLEEILKNHEAIAIEINRNIKPVGAYNEFLQFGSYPFSNNKDSLLYLSLIHI